MRVARTGFGLANLKHVFIVANQQIERIFEAIGAIPDEIQFFFLLHHYHVRSFVRSSFFFYFLFLFLSFIFSIVFLLLLLLFLPELISSNLFHSSKLSF
jgi:hypothetical protein